MGASVSEFCYAGEMERVDPKLKQYARELRNNATKAERLLWVRLRRFRPPFTRQLVVKPYIVDLACREAKLAIEKTNGVDFGGRALQVNEARPKEERPGGGFGGGGRGGFGGGERRGGFGGGGRGGYGGGGGGRDRY